MKRTIIILILCMSLLLVGCSKKVEPEIIDNIPVKPEPKVIEEVPVKPEPVVQDDAVVEEVGTGLNDISTDDEDLDTSDLDDLDDIFAELENI